MLATPCASGFDVIDQCKADVKFVSQGLRYPLISGAHWGRQHGCPDARGLFGSQLRVFATFLAHVFVVISQRSLRKVRVVDAGSNVATMKQRQLWPFSMPQEIRDAVRRNSAACAVIDLPVTASRLFVVSTGQAARPQPTFSLRSMTGRLVNLWPKSGGEITMNMLRVGHVYMVPLCV